MSRLEKPVVIGITGGSGSGKTTIAQKIVAQMQENEHVLIMTKDLYYKDNTGIPMSERKYINNDHPDAFEVLVL